MAVLDVQNISKRFGANEVLKDISFSLEQGKALAIIGSSGSGKTTLLRCLNFLERPNTGTIGVNGNLLLNAEDPKTLNDAEVRKNRLHFGLVFQSFNLFPQYTVLKNITLASELLAKETLAKAKGGNVGQNFKVQQKIIEEEAHELLKQMGLPEKAYAYPHQLSGGQQQRVAIARALAMHPSILCFDEPTSALDPELTGEVLRVIRGLANKKTTMLIVTHEMAFARDVADHVIFMDEGVIVEQGTPNDVITNPTHQRTKQFLARFAGE